MPFNYSIAFLPLALLAAGFATAGQAQTGPSFKCSPTMSSSAEALICQSDELSTLDRTLAGVYDTALKKAASAANILKAEQRGWIKGRDECWKAEDQQTCLRESYTQRIVEIQAGYGLVASSGPVKFECGSDGNVVVTFFQTDPPSINATYKNQQSLMVAVPSASGAHYQGRNESFWEHQGEARVAWGYGAKEMTCKKSG